MSTSTKSHATISINIRTNLTASSSNNVNTSLNVSSSSTTTTTSNTTSTTTTITTITSNSSSKFIGNQKSMDVDNVNGKSFSEYSNASHLSTLLATPNNSPINAKKVIYFYFKKKKFEKKIIRSLNF